MEHGNETMATAQLEGEHITKQMNDVLHKASRGANISVELEGVVTSTARPVRGSNALNKARGVNDIKHVARDTTYRMKQGGRSDIFSKKGDGVMSKVEQGGGERGRMTSKVKKGRGGAISEVD